MIKPFTTLATDSFNSHYLISTKIRHELLQISSIFPKCLRITTVSEVVRSVKHLKFTSSIETLYLTFALIFKPPTYACQIANLKTVRSLKVEHRTCYK